MINDGHGFIYEENRLQRGKKKYNIMKTDQRNLERVRKYLKDGTYKYLFTSKIIKIIINQ